MNKEEFTIFTEGYISELISWGELYLRKSLPKDNVILVSFDKELANGIEAVVDFLVTYAYESENSIKPCIDLSILSYDSKSVTINFMPAAYEGQPFGLNWTGKPGPYIKMINMNLLKEANKEFPKEWKLDT